MVYAGRDMTTVHIGMRPDEEDRTRAIGHLTATLAAFAVPEQEKGEVLGFTESLKPEIVEVF